jgi:hypothetical protein
MLDFDSTLYARDRLTTRKTRFAETDGQVARGHASSTAMVVTVKSEPR